MHILDTRRINVILPTQIITDSQQEAPANHGYPDHTVDVIIEINGQQRQCKVISCLGVCGDTDYESALGEWQELISNHEVALRTVQVAAITPKGLSGRSRQAIISVNLRTDTSQPDYFVSVDQ